MSLIPSLLLFVVICSSLPAAAVETEEKDTTTPGHDQNELVNNLIHKSKTTTKSPRKNTGHTINWFKPQLTTTVNPRGNLKQWSSIQMAVQWAPHFQHRVSIVKRGLKNVH